MSLLAEAEFGARGELRLGTKRTQARLRSTFPIFRTDPVSVGHCLSLNECERRANEQGNRYRVPHTRRRDGRAHPWQEGYSSPEIGKFKREELFDTDALLLGRKTYEEFAGYWPTASTTGDFGERMNALPKYVATTTLDSAGWNSSIL